MATVVVAGASLGSVPVFVPAASAAAPPEAGQYVPVNPTRVVTRGSVPPVTTAAPNAAFTFTPTSVAGVPASVSAVQFQLSTNAAGTGTLIAYPAGAARPAITTILYRPNVPMSNDVVVKLGTNNQVSIANVPSTGTTAVTAPVWIDIVGYYTGATGGAAGSTYVPLAPSRLFTQRPMAAGVASAVAPLGLGGVPATGASAVMAQVTVGATGSTPAGGFAQVYPGPTAPSPATSDINYGADYFYTDLVPVKLGADGQFRVMTTTATTLTVDIVGYFGTGAGSTFVGLPATRLPGGDIPPGGTLTVPGLGQAGVPSSGVTALSYNLTAKGNGTTAGTPDNLVAYPADLPAPPVTGGFYYRSGIYFSTQQTTKIGTGGIKILNRSTGQSAHVFVDITGYYATARLPNAPSNASAVAGNASATVTWQPPTTGPAPAGYAVLTNPGNTVTDVNSASTTTQITGLTNGSEYTFSVAARNSSGSSAYSAPSAAVTPSAPQPPGVPLITDVYPRDGALRVSWAPPTIGSSALTSYHITTTPATTTTPAAPDATEAIVGGLTNGQRYAVTVTAVNGVGPGQPSQSSQPVAPRPADAPLAPAITALTPGNGSVTAQWVSPTDGGAPVTGYTVTASAKDVPPQSVHTDAGTTVAAIPGLVNGTAYTVSVVAVNSAGTSDPGSAGPVTAAVKLPPSAPTHVRAAVAAAGAIRVQWEAPQTPGTAVISAYTVTASPGGATVTAPGTATAATISGLDASTGYTFTVHAASADGTGPDSSPTAQLSPAASVTATPVVLSAAALGTLRQVTAGTLAFEQPPPEVAGLQAGQIIVAHPGPQLPGGLLRAVTATNTTNRLLIVSTRDAAVNEVLAAGGVVDDSTLDTGDIASFTPLVPGVRLRQPTIGGRTAAQGAPQIGNGARPSDLGGSVGIQNGALVIELEGTGQLDGSKPLPSKLEAQFSVQPHIRLHLHASLLHNIDTEFGLSLQTSGQIQAKGGLGRAGKIERTIAEFRLNCVDVQVLVLPVVICTDVTVKAELDGQFSYGMALSANFNREFGGALTSHNADVQAHAINIAGPGNGISNHPYVDASLRLSFPWEYDFQLYGALGPDLVVTPSLEFLVDSTQSPPAELRLGITVGAQFALSKLLGGKVLFHEDDLLTFFITLWQAGSSPWVSLASDHPDGTKVDEPVQFGLTGHGGLPTQVPAHWSMVEGTGEIGETTGRYAAHEVGYGVFKAVPDTLQVEPVFAGIMVGPNVPRQPGGVTARPGRLSADVGWTPPDSDGGSPITGYAVTGTPSIGTVLVGGSATTAHVPGLAPGVRYTFQVRAINAIGAGQPAAAAPVQPNEALIQIGSATDVAVDADGNPDSAGFAGDFGVRLSGDGRYAFFSTTAASNLAPPDVAGMPGFYLLRKNLVTGDIDLASRGPDGRTPQPISPSGRAYPNQHDADSFDVDQDGSIVAYTTDSGVVLVHDIAHRTTWTASSADLGGGDSSPLINDTGAVVSLIAGGHLYRYTPLGRTQIDACPTGTPCVEDQSLSGDGNRLLAVEAVAGVGNVIVYTVGGSPVDMSPAFGHAETARLSPDGRLVLAGIFANIEGHHNGLALTPVGSKITEADYIETTNNEFQPWALSRDGRITAYNAARDPANPDDTTFAGKVWNGAVGASVRLPGPAGVRGETQLDLTDNGQLVAWTRCGPTDLDFLCDIQPGAWVQRYA